VLMRQRVHSKRDRNLEVTELRKVKFFAIVVAVHSRSASSEPTTRLEPPTPCRFAHLRALEGVTHRIQGLQ
jgi:hypothetical protein